MRRKSLWLAVAMLVVSGGSILATLYVLTQHEPAFYSRCAVPTGQLRTELSRKFFAEFVSFTQLIIQGGQLDTGNWRGSFSEGQINSYLAEDFLTSGMADKLLPDDISEPRFVIEQDRMRLGFRYGTAPWSTIISVDFRVWLAQREPNVVVLELRSLHAGALPISAQSLLEKVSDVLRGHGMQVTWYRHAGNPTAALQFQTNQPRPTAHLRQLDLRAGALMISGHSSEALPQRPSAPSAPRGN